MEMDEVGKARLAEMMSDWHLFSFLVDCGMFAKDVSACIAVGVPAVEADDRVLRKYSFILSL